MGQHPGARDDRPTVGAVLRRAREYHRLSIREVERRIGRSSAYLSQVERGVIRQPDPRVLLELADLYGLDFATLAAWAGWSSRPGEENLSSANIIVRRVLELDEKQRAELLVYVEGLARRDRT